ncbi:MAG TPA: 30S ribosome-binding factor RbfA [Steroidobacteraceae bacterium]|nr:30S ribosome-binding factor RbfA [Steroidobacteraceae bacterium]
MPREFHRSQRVGEQIQRLLAELIRREVKDPRVGLVTITAVEVSRDLTHAKVFFLPFDQRRPADEVGAALASAAGFLRIHLKKQLGMRSVPELRFLPDESIERAARVSALISAAVRDDAERADGAPPAAADAGDEPAP